MSAGRRPKPKRNRPSETLAQSKQPAGAVHGNDAKALVQSTLAYYAGWFKKVESRPDSPFHGTHKRFCKFADGAEGDLESLASKGVGPPVVVCLMFEGILMRVDDEWTKKSKSDWRRFASYNYWHRGRQALIATNAFLSEFASSPTARIIAEHFGSPDFDPFVKACRRAFEAASKVQELLGILEELGLHAPGWTLKYEIGKPLYRKSEIAGRKKSGRYRKEDWGLTAAKLHECFRRTTGKPHWGTIARLLHFAGYEDFPNLIPPEGTRTERGSDEMVERWEYKNRIRARVRQIMSDPPGIRAVERAFSDYQRMWETARPQWLSDLGIGLVV